MFTAEGFTVTAYEGLYYNPNNRKQFYVEHAKASAISLFLLKFDSMHVKLTVSDVGE